MKDDPTPDTKPANAGHAYDVSVQRVAGVYAAALLNAAEKRGEVNAILSELEALVRDVFRADPQFEAFLSSGAIGRRAKADAIRSIFENRTSELFFNFVMVLNEHERLDLIRPILSAFKELRDQRARRVRVQVRTAVPLAGDQLDQLRLELVQAFQLEPVLETQIDPELLGGIVVRVGDWLYDASVRTQLETLRNQLTTRSSHEIQSRRDRFSYPNGN